jgi:hypothetical protein
MQLSSSAGLIFRHLLRGKAIEPYNPRVAPTGFHARLLPIARSTAEESAVHAQSKRSFLDGIKITAVVTWSLTAAIRLQLRIQLSVI